MKQIQAILNKSILIKRLAAVLGIDMLVRASGLLLLPVYLSLMPQKEFGTYTYLYSFGTVMATILNFGLYIPMGKLYLEDRSAEKKKSTVLFTIGLLMLGLFLSVYLLIYVFNIDELAINYLLSNIDDREKFRYPLFLLIASGSFNFMLTYYFIISEKIKVLSIYNICRVILINGSALLMLYFNPGNKDTSAIRIYAMSGSEIVLLFLFSKIYFQNCRWVFETGLLKKVFSLATPIMISAILGLFINFSDKFILEKYITIEQLSIYYLAITIAGIITMLAAAFQNSWLPIFLKDDIMSAHQRTKRIQKKYVIVLIILSCAIYLCLWIALKLKVIGSDYFDALHIIPFVLAMQIIISLTTIYSNYLIHLGKTYYTIISGAFVCILTIGINLSLIPSWGIYGAATSGIIANTAYLLFYVILVHRIFRGMNNKTMYV